MYRRKVEKSKSDEAGRKLRKTRKERMPRLTVEQFKAILALCVGGVEPWRSDKEIEDEVAKVDIEQLSVKMNQQLVGMDEEEDIGEVLRRSLTECKEDDCTLEEANEGREDEEGTEDRNPRSFRERNGNLDDLDDDLDDLDASLGALDEVDDSILDELPDLVSPCSWGVPEDWDSPPEIWDSGSNSSPHSSKGGSPRGYSPPYVPYYSPCSWVSEGTTPPPIKKTKRDYSALPRSGTLEMTPSPASSPTTFSPFLAKKVPEGEVITISSDSSEDGTKRRKVVRKLIDFEHGERKEVKVEEDRTEDELPGINRIALLAEIAEGGADEKEDEECKEDVRGDTEEKDQNEN